MQISAMAASLSDTEGSMSQFPDLDSLELLPHLAPEKGSAVGARIYPLKGAQLKLMLGPLENPIRIPFEAGSFEQDLASTRVNICYELNDTNRILFFEALDANIIQLLTDRSVCFQKGL